ncbi:MAG: hypothetical protein IJT72_02680 [Lachnospiraceae bacterium]|nr:hypothetical protein [Lachnospiraceae bacterium]
MLKIKAPIELKCNTDVTTVGDFFGERIRGNYGVMGAGLTGEELLHLVNRPPEIYLEEGGITNLVSESNIENRQYNKVEIINNFLNRVLVNADANLTYQDRVFITNVLNNLGIKDERYFMHQVHQIKQEINNTEELVNLYWNNLTRLESLVNDYREGDTSTQVNQDIDEKTELHLHENIMNRLMTGSLYKIVQNFSEHISGDTTITKEEYQMSEQNRLTQNILLNRLQNMVRHESFPLTYRHENVYEETIGGDTEITEENINTRVNSAVLLNMIDNMYQSRRESFIKGGDKVFRMENTFYESADNTIQRITENVEQHLFFNSELSNTEERVEQLTDEIDIINNILSESHTEQLRLLTDADYRQYRNTSYRSGDVANMTHAEFNISEGNTEITEGDNVSIKNNTVNYGDDVTKSESRMIHVDNSKQISDETSIEIDNINRELTLINEQNLARNEEYIQNLNRINNELKTPTYENDRKRTVADSLKALESPMEFLREVKQENEARKNAEELREDAMLNALPERERETTRLLKEYLERPEVFRDRRIVTENNLTQLMADVNRVERENRIREESEAIERVEKETVTEIVTETVRELKQSQPRIKSYERPPMEISLVHKSQETFVNEELIDEIVSQNRQIERQNERIDTIINNNNTETKTIVNNTEHHVITEQNQDVTDAVRRSIQGQMDSITDKVYNKLSKRLANEKIRRGL